MRRPSLAVVFLALLLVGSVGGAAERALVPPTATARAAALIADWLRAAGRQ